MLDAHAFCNAYAVVTLPAAAMPDAACQMPATRHYFIAMPAHAYAADAMPHARSPPIRRRRRHADAASRIFAITAPASVARAPARRAPRHAPRTLMFERRRRLFARVCALAETARQRSHDATQMTRSRRRRLPCRMPRCHSISPPHDSCRHAIPEKPAVYAFSALS